MIKKWVINQNDSADVRGLDENGKEICWLNTNHSFEVLMKTAEFSEALTAPYSVQILKPKPVVMPIPPKPIPVPVPVPTASSWDDFIAAVANYKDFPYPWMKELIVAQSIIESGRGTTELAKFKNFNGMKSRPELEKFGGVKFKYFTSSEPFRDENGKEVPEGTPGAKQWDWFFSFSMYSEAIATWVNWWNRAPYPKVIAKDPEVLKDLEHFLAYIGPIYCPYFTNTHNESYALYIINRCLPEARVKLAAVVPSKPQPPEVKTKIKGKGVLINNGHNRHGAGATSTNDQVDEFDLNLFQAQRIQKTLVAAGIPCTIINQVQTGGLTETGLAAEGYDAFLCLHHNATVGAQGSSFLLGDAVKAASKAFGALLSKRIATVLGIKDRGYESRVVSVMSGADKTNCPIAVLVESYFIDSIVSMNDALDMSGRAADVISGALLEKFV